MNPDDLLPVRVYVAAPWVKKLVAIETGRLLEQAGFIVTSHWFSHEGDPQDLSGIKGPVDYIREQAEEDMHDVLGSDVLVVLNLEKSEGKAVETGIAIANAIPIISVGGRSNIFQTLGIEVETLDEAIAAIRTLYPRPSFA